MDSSRVLKFYRTALICFLVLFLSFSSPPLIYAEGLFGNADDDTGETVDDDTGGQTVDDVVKQINDEIRKVESKELEVLNEITQIDSKTDSTIANESTVQTRITEAETSLDFVKNNITEVNTATATLKSKTRKLKEDNRDLETEIKKLNTKITKKLGELEVFISDISELGKQIDLKAEEIVQVKIFIESIKKIFSDLSISITSDKVIIDSFTDVSDLHGRWLDSLIRQIEQWTPDFSMVQGIPSFNNEFGKVRSFEKNIPSAKGVEKSEALLSKNIKNQNKSVSTIQSKIRKITGIQGLAIYNNFKKSKESLNIFENIDKILQEKLDSLKKAQELLKEMSTKRTKIPLAVRGLWIKLLELSLQAANVINAEEIVKQANLLERSEENLVKIKQALNKKKEKIKETLFIYFSPLTAKRINLSFIQLIKNIRKNLDELPLSLPHRNTILDYLNDGENSFTNYSKEIQFSLQAPQINEYHEDRKNEIRQNLPVSMTDSCREMADFILDSSPELRNEIVFLNFKSKC